MATLNVYGTDTCTTAAAVLEYPLVLLVPPVRQKDNETPLDTSSVAIHAHLKRQQAQARTLTHDDKLH